MTSEPELTNRLTAHIRQTLGTELPSWPGGWPHQVECALLDAVYSIQARYGGEHNGVRGVVGRWRRHRGGTADDLTVLATTAESDLLRILENNARASGRSKAALAIDAAAALAEVGVRSSRDFTASNAQKAA